MGRFGNRALRRLSIRRNRIAGPGRAAALAFAAALPAIAAPSVQAEPVAARFAPPIDRDIGYHTAETRNQKGTALTFTLEQRVRFTRAGDGLLMKTTLLSAATDATGPVAARFDAAFRPFVGLTTTLRLNAQGKPLGLADEAATWANLMRTIDALKQDKGLAPETAATIAAIFADIGKLPPAQRAAMLSEGPMRLIGFAMPPMELDQGVRTGDAKAGASATLTAIRDDVLVYALRTRAPAAQGVDLISDAELEVDRATGLLHRSTSREWLGDEAKDKGEKPNVEIVITRAPDP